MERRIGWLEWRIVLPWTVGTLGFFIASHWLLAWAIKCSIVREAQLRVGARVEIGDSRVNIPGGRVSLRQIAIANPQAPLRNLVEAERCDVQLAALPLLHKQAVVEYGALSGVTFGADRTTSGALEAGEVERRPASAWFDDRAAQHAERWLAHIYQRFDRKFLSEFESVHLANALVARWPEQAAALEQRSAELRGRVAAFHAKVRDAQENPLRHVDFLKNFTTEIKAIRDDVAAFTKEIEKLPNLADDDRQAILAARQHDEQLLAEELKFEPVDANMLAAYLLKKQLQGPLAEVVGWLELIRRVVPADSQPLVRRRHRGREIVFQGLQPAPQLLIRKLQIQGVARLAGRPLQLMGVITDVTDRPECHDQPIRVQLTAQGAMPLEIRATIDRTGAVARDELVADCGNLVFPKLQLGGSSKLRLTLAPTTATLQVRLLLEGDTLSGDIKLQQKQVVLTPIVDDTLRQRHFDGEFAKSLSKVESLTTMLTIAGTLERPKCEVTSDLGPAVAQALDVALRTTAKAYARELLTASREQVDQQLVGFSQQLAAAQAAFAPQLSDANDNLDQLARKSNGERLSVERLGRSLPAASLFR